MSLLGGGPGYLDYPAYQVSVLLGSSPETASAPFGFISLTNNPTDLTDEVMTDIISHLSSFFGGYDWSGFDAGTYQGLSVSKMVQTTTNITPA